MDLRMVELDMGEQPPVSHEILPTIPIFPWLNLNCVVKSPLLNIFQSYQKPY